MFLTVTYNFSDDSAITINLDFHKANSKLIANKSN